MPRQQPRKFLLLLISSSIATRASSVVMVITVPPLSFPLLLPLPLLPRLLVFRSIMYEDIFYKNGQSTENVAGIYPHTIGSNRVSLITAK